MKKIYEFLSLQMLTPFPDNKLSVSDQTCICAILLLYSKSESLIHFQEISPLSR
jgi:hypothetical protein